MGEEGLWVQVGCSTGESLEMQSWSSASHIRISFAAILFLRQKNKIHFQAWMKTHRQCGGWEEGSARPGGGGVRGVAVAVVCPLQHEPGAVLW